MLKPMRPDRPDGVLARSSYGAAEAYGHSVTVNYRESYNPHATN